MRNKNRWEKKSNAHAEVINSDISSGKGSIVREGERREEKGREGKGLKEEEETVKPTRPLEEAREGEAGLTSCQNVDRPDDV